MEEDALVLAVDFDLIAMILVIVVPLGAAVAFITKLEMRVKQLEKEREDSKENPLDILKRKLANQEISEEKYEKLKRKLQMD